MKNMKSRFILFAAMMAVLIGSGSAATLQNHDIYVQVGETGDAAVIENFVLTLTESEAYSFDKLSERNAQLEEWTGFSDSIKTNMLNASAESIEISTTKISGGQFGYQVQLKYTASGLAKPVSEAGRIRVYEISKESFSFYNAAQDYFAIPTSSRLTISLPDSISESDILETVPKPWTVTNKKTLIWTGGTYSGDFSIKFQKEMAISESFDINRIMEYLMQNPVYSVVIILFLILAVIYRREITGLITESFAGEEEVLPPKREVGKRKRK
ncbi:MAG: hypothetical protein V1911_01525 [Candidatus Micrarchaeota archaeon]